MANVKIEQYGDSTTQGWQGGSSGYVTPMSAPVQLQAKLQRAIGTNVTVSNQGVGGAQAQQLLAGTDGVHPAWSSQMAASTAQIVTLNFGMNDAYYAYVPTTTAPAQTPAQFKATLTSLIIAARAAGKTVFLIEPNPTCEPIRRQALLFYVQAMREVAVEQSVGIVHHFDALLTVDNWQALLSDGIHPTDALYAIKASAEFDVLISTVKTLAGQ